MTFANIRSLELNNKMKGRICFVLALAMAMLLTILSPYALAGAEQPVVRFSSKESATYNPVLEVANQVKRASQITIQISPNTINTAIGETATLTGVLKDASAGTGIAGAIVYLYYVHGATWTNFLTVTTKSDGSFSAAFPMSAVPNGEYTFTAKFFGNDFFDASSNIAYDHRDRLFVVPEYMFGGLLAIAACFAAFFITKQCKFNFRHP